MSKVYLVGLGPGGQQEITPRAMAAMKESGVIAGYTGYIELVRDLLPGKEFVHPHAGRGGAVPDGFGTCGGGRYCGHGVQR